MENVGFIGLGTMGKPMCGRLVAAGLDVTVFDIMKEPQEELIKKGARGASSPAEMAKSCSVIITMVRNDEETEEVITGRDGIIRGMEPGMLLVIMSTVSPGLCKRMAGVLSEKGGSVLDAPVTNGGAQACAEGILTILVGGNKSDFDRCLPIFQHVGKQVFHLGAVGNGQTTKIVNNMVQNATHFSLVESLALAKAAGLDLARTREVMSLGSSRSWVLEHFDLLTSRRTADEPVLRAICYKDIGLAVKLADDLHADLPVGKCCQGIDISSEIEVLLH